MSIESDLLDVMTKYVKKYDCPWVKPGEMGPVTSYETSWGWTSGCDTCAMQVQTIEMHYTIGGKEIIYVYWGELGKFISEVSDLSL